METAFVRRKIFDNTKAPLPVTVRTARVSSLAVDNLDPTALQVRMPGSEG